MEILLRQMGFNFRLIDNEAVTVCPYHDDHSPSFSINIKNGLWHCFSCGAKGNFARLLSDMLGWDYNYSILMTNEVVGHARMDKWRENYDNISFSPMSLKVTETDMALFTDPPPEALNSKNITLEAAKYYNIQWNPEHQTWICPYRDPYSNELWGWQEKNARIFRNYPAGTKKSKTLFGINKLVGREFAILVESPLDCAVIYSAGLWNAVSTFGIPTGTYQLSLLQYKRIGKLILALDNDKAGESATRDLIYESVKMFDTVRVFNYLNSNAKDPGEMSYDHINNGLVFATPALQWLRRNR